MLKRGLEQEFGGTLSFRGMDDNAFAAEWEGASFASLLVAAEGGRLDRIVQPHGLACISEILRNGECCYQTVQAVPRDAEPVPLRSIGAEALKQDLLSAQVLVLTATEIEREAVHRAMSPWPGTGHILQGPLGPRVYHLGMLGGYTVAQTSSTMGSVGRQGSTITALQAIQEVAPIAVILIGIAFGVNRIKQRLGDVIVAESIFPYELQRVDGVSSIRRGTEMQCGLVLSNRFRELRSDWHLAGGTRDVRVQQGLMLSGEKLIDNQAFRDDLRAEFPTALGGEMEGAGAYAAASETKIEMILIKAICDWADGHKDDHAQPFAAYAAVSLVKHVLSKSDALRALGASPRRAGNTGSGGASGITVDVPDPWAEIRRLAPLLYETGPTERNVWKRSGGDLSRINVMGDGGTVWDSALHILERGGGGTTLRRLIAVMCDDYSENEVVQALARSLVDPVANRRQVMRPSCGLMSPSREPNTPQVALHALMVELFSANELRRWLRHSPYANLIPELPGETTPLADLIDQALAALERRGCIDAGFFERLEIERPHKKNAIVAVAERWLRLCGSGRDS